MHLLKEYGLKRCTTCRLGRLKETNFLPLAQFIKKCLLSVLKSCTFFAVLSKKGAISMATQSSLRPHPFTSQITLQPNKPGRCYPSNTCFTYSYSALFLKTLLYKSPVPVLLFQECPLRQCGRRGNLHLAPDQ